MITTRTNHQHSLIPMLPYRDRIITIHLRDLYTAWKEDYIQFIFEEKLLTPEKLEARFSGVHREKDNYILSIYRDDPNNTVLLSSIPASQRSRRAVVAMANHASVIFKPSFTNKRSHVEGVIDALYSGEFIHQRFGGTMVEAAYTAVIMVHRAAFNEYDQIRAAAYLLYGASFLPGERVLLHNIKTGVAEFYTPTAEDYKKVREMVRCIRHTRRYADAFFTLKSFHTRALPNMKNTSDIWETEKKRYADEFGEITRLWGCTMRHRKRGLSMGISSWRDDSLTASLLGFDGRRQRIIDAILRVNRHRDNEPWILVHNDHTLSPLRDHRQGRYMFVDFEWTDHVYLIGVFDSHGGYKAYWADSMDRDAITAMYRRFIDSLRDDDILVYWHAEAGKWGSEMTALGMNGGDLKWVDLCAIMREGVTVKGAYDFSLKNVARAFYKQGAMPYFIDDFECQNGQDSILFAKEYYRTGDAGIKASIEKYNKFDCESMFHIATALVK
jgi:hypothetical protein